MNKQYNILDSMPSLQQYQTFTERYFTKRYILDVGGVKDNDIMIMFHSNRIALLCLAPTHFFFKNNEDFKINFTIGKVDRLSNAVKGKGKKGGQGLMPNSVICKIEYPDGSGFNVPCGMKSTLVEINENLVKKPDLLREMPDADGFIAIILSSIAISEATKDELLTHEEYMLPCSPFGMGNTAKHAVAQQTRYSVYQVRTCVPCDSQHGGSVGKRRNKVIN